MHRKDAKTKVLIYRLHFSWPLHGNIDKNEAEKNCCGSGIMTPKSRQWGQIFFTLTPEEAAENEQRTPISA